MLHARRRADVPAARIVRLTSRAAAMPGVHAVVTAADAPGFSVRPWSRTVTPFCRRRDPLRRRAPRGGRGRHTAALQAAAAAAAVEVELSRSRARARPRDRAGRGHWPIHPTGRVRGRCPRTARVGTSPGR
ncbi:hypothetical protein HBB16_06540 [Pseudonocardia sp. MCCB 268]|nr:hypothetical protein [Pseudonocardia cytotoxica]